jgi:hypothetical protein
MAKARRFGMQGAPSGKTPPGATMIWAGRTDRHLGGAFFNPSSREGPAMFAPMVRKAPTKAATSPTIKPIPQGSTHIMRPVYQNRVEREAGGASMTGWGATRGGSWISARYQYLRRISQMQVSQRFLARHRKAATPTPCLPQFPGEMSRHHLSRLPMIAIAHVRTGKASNHSRGFAEARAR